LGIVGKSCMEGILGETAAVVKKMG